MPPSLPKAALSVGSRVPIRFSLGGACGRWDGRGARANRAVAQCLPACHAKKVRASLAHPPTIHVGGQAADKVQEACRGHGAERCPRAEGGRASCAGRAACGRQPVRGPERAAFPARGAPIRRETVTLRLSAACVAGRDRERGPGARVATHQVPQPHLGPTRSVRRRRTALLTGQSRRPKIGPARRRLEAQRSAFPARPLPHRQCERRGL